MIKTQTNTFLILFLLFIPNSKQEKYCGIGVKHVYECCGNNLWWEEGTIKIINEIKYCKTEYKESECGKCIGKSGNFGIYTVHCDCNDNNKVCNGMPYCI